MAGPGSSRSLVWNERRARPRPNSAPPKKRGKARSGVSAPVTAGEASHSKYPPLLGSPASLLEPRLPQTSAGRGFPTDSTGAPGSDRRRNAPRRASSFHSRGAPNPACEERVIRRNTAQGLRVSASACLVGSGGPRAIVPGAQLEIGKMGAGEIEQVTVVGRRGEANRIG